MKPADIAQLLVNMPELVRSEFIKDLKELQFMLSNYELITSVLLSELKTLNTANVFEFVQKMKRLTEMNAPDFYKKFYPEQPSDPNIFIPRTMRPGTIDFLLRQLAASRSAEAKLKDQLADVVANSNAKLFDMSLSVSKAHSKIAAITKILEEE